ncbi:MAG: SDR family oxidoreductase [Maribacter sp.]
MRIDNKTVWITGASSGIGEALTYLLDKKNCKLILSSRNESELLRVKSNCQNKDTIHIVCLDLAAYETMSDITEDVISKYGPIDVLINNAGLSQRSLIAETEFDVFKKLMDVNYLGTVALTKALLPHFITNQNGHYVTVTSLMGKFGSPYRSGYCGAKHALHGFFDVLRMEHEKDGISVTLICPGFVNTNVAKNALTANGSAQNEQDTATQSGMLPEVLAKRMIRAVERNKFEAYIGGKERFATYLRLFPKLIHKIVLKSTVR